MFKITDKDFRYTPSFNTDLKKRCRNIMRENRAAAATEARAVSASSQNSVALLLLLPLRAAFACRS